MQFKKTVAAVAAVGAFAALGATASSAMAASTYTTSAASQSATLTTSKLAKFAVGNVTVQCTGGGSTAITRPGGLPVSPATAALPDSTLTAATPTFTGCTGKIAGLSKVTTVTTCSPTTGTWKATLFAAAYTGALVLPTGTYSGCGGFPVQIVVGTCTIQVGPQSIAANLIDKTTGAAPGLGSPANALAFPGSALTISYAAGSTGCPTTTAATFTANTAADLTTGYYELSGTITES